VHQIAEFVVTKIVFSIKEPHVSYSATNNELKREGQSLKRRAVLALITVGCCLFLAFLMWKGLGKQAMMGEVKATPWSNDPLNDPTYRAREKFIIDMIALNGSRPYNSEELEFLRQLAQMKEGDCLWRDHRGDAIYLLSWSPDPEQRKEAYHFAIDGLKDPCWYIRALSIKALARLKAKNAIPSILPLLNDTHPEVRKQAKKALQQLGYKVGE
jgi:hypothetical protein